MKKILFAVALLFCVNATFSQNFDKKIEASDKSIEDPKKKDNPKTWITRAQLFTDIVSEPSKGLWSGMTSIDYTLISSQIGKPENESTAVINNKTYGVSTFADKKVYFNEDKSVAFWEVTKYAVTDPYKKAYDSYIKAAELDQNKGNSKKIAEGLISLSNYAKNEGFNQFQMGKNQGAMDAFKLSLDCSSNPLVNQKDTTIMYYTAIMAAELKDYNTAEQYFRECLKAGYEQKGDVNATLGEVLIAKGDKDGAEEVLKQALKKFPENQQVMIALINSYMSSGKNPAEIIPLLKQVQASQPENHSLYFAEGQLYEKLNEFDNAAKSYEQAIKIKPDYFLGYYGLGVVIFNKGVKYTEKAGQTSMSENEEYDRLMKLADDEFKKALPIFEKAYELDPKEKSVVQALKDINQRFAAKDPAFKEKADKYKELLDSME